ncbi:MAG TPA: hypothetical protein VM285_02940 [Polyangia bacterium]|nr:hypothetical protein [Polyangia bacterium]
MHVLALILGILSLVVFCWLGPLIGGIMAAPSAEELMSGNFEMSAGAIYVWGILIGGVLPLLAVVFGFMGLKKSKGMAITGMVLGGLGAIIGIVMTVMAGAAVGMASEMAGGLQQGLNDPAMQQMMQQGLDQAMQEAAQQAGQAVPQ